MGEDQQRAVLAVEAGVDLLVIGTVKDQSLNVYRIEVKLIDFSIAQKQRRGLTKLLFGKSKVQGTRSYMSPEQAEGRPVDARSDIFSFGSVLYEMVTGTPPFRGKDYQDTLSQITERDPRPPL